MTERAPRLLSWFFGSRISDYGEELVNKCSSHYLAMAAAHNASAPETLRVTVESPVLVKDDGSRTAIRRFFMSTPFWALSMRVQDNLAKFYLFPAIELTSIAQAESPHRRKLQLQLVKEKNGYVWNADGAAVDESELLALLNALFTDMIKSSRGELERVPEWVRVGMQEYSVTGVIKALLSDKQRLIVSLVGEHEAAKANIAREIHDTVLSDIHFLQRSLTGDKALTDEQMLKVLDSISARLRAVCADLSPRDLQEWGMTLMLKDLAVRYTERTGAQCVVKCLDEELPALPNDVGLQVFRIMQECLNNAAKHSKATEVSVTVSLEKSPATRLRFTVEDNGVGFDLEKLSIVPTDNSGRGNAIMRERLELIRHTLPGHLTVHSAPQQGTKVSLEIELPAQGAGCESKDLGQK